MQLGFGLSLTLPRGGASPFSPRSLFSNGEQGAWFDPSDLSSMYQDAAGTIPAAIGQPVGRIRNKAGIGDHASQATTTARPTLARMPKVGVRNLITSTVDFNWTAQNTTISGASGAVKLEETAGTAQHHIYVQAGTMVAGTYTFSAVISAAERTQCYLSLATAAKRKGAYFDLQSLITAPDAGVTASIADVGGGRRMCSITLSATTAAHFAGIFTASGMSYTVAGVAGSGIVLHSAQVEEGAIITPHQRVGASARDVTEDGVPTLTYLYRDPVDDVLPWTAPAGSYDIAHIPLTGPATVLTEQALSGDANILLAENTRAYLAIDRRLTMAEIDALAAYYGASA